MRSLLITLTMAAATWATACAQSQVFELAFLGSFNSPVGNWEILEDRKTSTHARGFTFTILRNSSTGDLLSFAVYDKPGSELLTLVDTAHEIFPDGRPASFSSSPDERFTIWSLKWRIANRLNQQVLEYSFVAEHGTPERNRLAHGYALVGDRTVFVQHTSQRPVTPALAQKVSATVLRRLVQKSDPANLKKSEKRAEPDPGPPPRQK